MFLLTMIYAGNTTTIALVGLGILCLVVGFMIYNVRREMMVEEAVESGSEMKTIPLTVHEKTFEVEIAQTAIEREIGLMNRESMDSDKGMLFIFNKKFIYPFWMKNTLIPLDIIWLDENKKVVFINEDTQPCGNSIEALCKSVVPTSPALYVVEFNSGTVKDLNIKLGDQFNWELN